MADQPKPDTTALAERSPDGFPVDGITAGGAPDDLDLEFEALDAPEQSAPEHPAAEPGYSGGISTTTSLDETRGLPTTATPRGNVPVTPAGRTHRSLPASGGQANPGDTGGRDPLAEVAARIDEKLRAHSYFDFTGLLTRIERDPTAVFEDPALKALVKLRTRDLPLFNIYRELLKQYRVRLRDLAAAMKFVVTSDNEMFTDAESSCGVKITWLGHDKGIYYFLSSEGQVVSIEGNWPTSFFFQLAPYDFWLAAFPGDDEPKWKLAMDYLMQKCHARGIYNPNMVRGRGAWVDGGRVVLHTGSHLIVLDSEEDRRAKSPDSLFWTISDLAQFESRHIYEAGVPIQMPPLTNPLSDAESKILLDCCQRLRFKNPAFGRLFAGFIALAPVCGAIPWRPHGWLTAGAGSGKSWIMTNIVRPVLEPLNTQMFLSSTTEAGIRGTVKSDALPVLFDEAESHDQRAKTRIRGILELIRQASAETGGRIVKGTAAGHSKQFMVRSMFLLSSINVGLEEQADFSRFTIFELRSQATDPVDRRIDEENFREIRRLSGYFTENYAMRLFARMVRLIPVVLANTEVFVKATADALNSQRLGDQYGVMLAGAQALVSDKLVTPDEASVIVRGMDWSSVLELTEDRDEHRCLRTILNHEVRVEFGGGQAQTINLGELIQVAYTGRLDSTTIGPTQDEALRNLRRNGIVLRDRYAAVANKHEALSRILRETPWATNWKLLLERIPDAIAMDTLHYGPGMKSRAIGVPLYHILLDSTGDVPAASV